MEIDDEAIDGLAPEVTEASDTEETKPVEGTEPSEHVKGEHGNVDENFQGEESEVAEGEHVEGEEREQDEYAEGEQIAGEHISEEYVPGEHIAVEHITGEHVEEEQAEGEEVIGEDLEGEQAVQQTETATTEPEFLEEEQAFVEEPPPDPAAPYNLSDSKEKLREPFELRPEQIAEVEQLWDLYQDYTPAYTDIKGYITEKELIYMLKCLLLMTYTPEQLQELIEFCVRPPHPQGHITYEQFLNIVKLRQRDFPAEDELRQGLQVLDPGKTTTIDRTYFREVLGKMGNKMPQRQLEYLIKEVDIANDGTIGIEDVVGTMCIDLNRDDIIMLRQQIYPDEKPPESEDGDDY